MKKVILATIGIALWSIAVPWLGKALDLSVDVSTRLEVADHVVPGIVAVLAGTWALRISDRPTATPFLVAAGIIFLAGLWMTSTHVPLVIQATRDQVGWAAALWHSTGGPMVMILGIVMFFGTPPARTESPDVQPGAVD